MLTDGSRPRTRYGQAQDLKKVRLARALAEIDEVFSISTFGDSLIGFIPRQEETGIYVQLDMRDRSGLEEDFRQAATR
jgi:hypothetical protein